MLNPWLLLGVIPFHVCAYKILNGLLSSSAHCLSLYNYHIFIPNMIFYPMNENVKVGCSHFTRYANFFLTFDILWTSLKS